MIIVAVYIKNKYGEKKCVAVWQLLIKGKNTYTVVSCVFVLCFWG